MRVKKALGSIFSSSSDSAPGAGGIVPNEWYCGGYLVETRGMVRDLESELNAGREYSSSGPAEYLRSHQEGGGNLEAVSSCGSSVGSDVATS